MASSKEKSLPIESFTGVNRHVDREIMSPSDLWQAKNLWERNIGLLETRGGSERVLDSDVTGFPSNISKFMSNKKLYKKDGSSSRIVAAQCTPDTDQLDALPDGFTVSLVDDADGFWTNVFAFGGLNYGGAPSLIVIRFVGYGVDQHMFLPYTEISGYNAATDQKLRVAVAAELDSNITGYEVYVRVNTGTTSSPTDTDMEIWAGYQSLVRQTYPLSTDFYGCPLGQGGTVTNGTESGDLSLVDLSFDVELSAAAPGQPYLEAGVYYVSILPLHTLLGHGTAANRRCCYRTPRVGLSDNAQIRVVNVAEEPFYISISNISPNIISYILCIGKSPETLRPYKVVNDSANAYAGNPAVISGFPSDSPAVINIDNTGYNEASLSFRASTYSVKDMFVSMDDDGLLSPVFYSNTCSLVNNDGSAALNYSAGYFQHLYEGVASGINAVPQLGDGSRYDFIQVEDRLFFVNDYNPIEALGPPVLGWPFDLQTGSNYSLCDGTIATPVITEYQGVPLIPNVVSASSVAAGGSLANSTTYYFRVSRTSTTSGEENAATDVQSQTTGTADEAISLTMPATTGYTYSIYFGPAADDLRFHSGSYAAAASVTILSIPDSSGSIEVLPIKLPCFKFINYFQESVILTGGAQGQSRYDETPRDSLLDTYFSRAINPFNFTIPGIASNQFQTFRAGNDNEPNSGLAIYSNTTGDTGPFSQLVVGKKSSLYILNNLPAVGASDAVVRTLSGKVGIANHFATINSPVGTFVLAIDNVYLLRESGEPTPVGLEISSILRDADLSMAFACYHDQHMKLSFRHPDYYRADYDTESYNNVEFWLNVNKMTISEGRPDWVGPMVGRSVQYCFVEDHSRDGLIYSLARDRYVCDGSFCRVYKADVPTDSGDDPYDFNSPVESAIEFKDFKITQEDNNWNKLIKKLYWKMKTTRLVDDPVIARQSVYMDGVLSYENTVSISAASEQAFAVQPLKLIPSFPVGRPRGRTFRAVLEFDGMVGIGGFQVNFEVEKRRI